MLAFELLHTVKQEGPVSIAETGLFSFHIHVGAFFVKPVTRNLDFSSDIIDKIYLIPMKYI